MGLALRASLIWHDEVMQDVVCERREPVTLGASGATTFVTPDLGLPEEFAVLRAGARGYVLTLGPRMRGTMCIGGVATSVEDYVAAHAGDNPFCATPIECADWGVVELDDSGVYKLFFQFVPVEDAQPVLTRGMLLAGGVGWAIGSLVLTTLWLAKGFGVAEALFRGAGLVTLALGGALFLHRLLKNDNESRVSLLFSMVLHAAFLFLTFQVYSTKAAQAWPQERTSNASYYVARFEQRAVQEVITPIAFPAATQASSTPPIPVANPMPSTRIRVQPPGGNPMIPARREVPPPRAKSPDGPGLLGKGLVDDVTKRDTRAVTHGLDGAQRSEVPGFGPLTTRDSKEPPKPPGGPPGPPGPPAPPQPPLITIRPPVKACVGDCREGGPTDVDPAEPSDDSGPKLTEQEIKAQIRARNGIIRMCFQRQVDKKPDMKGGSIVVKFKIAADGRVVSPAKTRGTMNDPEVVGCVLRQVGTMRFRASGGANVTFPVVFDI
jgi:hypothetical protein